MRVVIIGGGMAGRRLAELLPPDDVTVLGDEPSYNRGRLTEYVAGRAEVARGNEPSAAAVAVDRRRQVVTDAEGRQYAYDRLVFATGAVPVVPEGVGPAAGIRTLRSADDAEAIVAEAAQVRRAVVLGGGVLGVETACALRERGVAVTLVELGLELAVKSGVLVGLIVDGESTGSLTVTLEWERDRHTTDRHTTAADHA